MYVVICKIDHCIHIHWCIPMGLGHNDPWVESHMWPQQTWGQRSSRGQWPLVQVFGKKGQCIHILWCIFKSNITMIAKVCDRESRWDSWFENRLVEGLLLLSCLHRFPILLLYEFTFAILKNHFCSILAEEYTDVCNIFKYCSSSYKKETSLQWRSHGGSKGHSLTAKKITKNRDKEGLNWEKEGQNWGKEDKLGRKGKDREGSFTLPLLTDTAGYATTSL